MQKRIALIFTLSVLVLYGAGFALHRWAVNDVTERTSRLKADTALMNARAQLENDELRVQNDLTEIDIARLEGRKPNYSKLRRDQDAVRADQDALRAAEQRAGEQGVAEHAAAD